MTDAPEVRPESRRRTWYVDHRLPGTTDVVTHRVRAVTASQAIGRFRRQVGPATFLGIREP